MELRMPHIRTTATAVEKLKAEAKGLSKTARILLTSAREQVARQAGYDNWKHVTVCAAETLRAPWEVGLPRAIEAFLAEHLANNPSSPATAAALTTGLVFALDVKDAEGLRHPDGVRECEDAMPAVATDVARHYYSANDGFDGSDDDDVLMFCTDELSNYRFFRYAGPRSGASLNDAFADVLAGYFFPPEFVWLDGKFIAMSNVDEVKVGEKVVLKTHRAQDGALARSYGHVEPVLASRARARDPVAAEQLARALFQDPVLLGLVDGRYVAAENSAGGGCFAKTSTGDRVCVDATEATSGAVLPVLYELLKQADLQPAPAAMQADVSINGTELCLSVVLPPVSEIASWSAIHRSAVKDSVRRPISLSLTL